MRINQITRILLLSFGVGLSSSPVWAEVSPTKPIETEQPTGTGTGILDQIPRLIDATPTILPEQSDEAMVPTTEETEDKSWADKKQKRIREM